MLMFTQATYAVHAPALSLQEAAMLPAISREVRSNLPGNLILPDRRTYHPMPPPRSAAPERRRGSMAGRAVLKLAACQMEKGRA